MVASELYLVNSAGDELLQAVVQHHLFLTSRGKHSSLQTACTILRRYGVSTDLKERVRSGELLPTTREGILQLKAAQMVKFVGSLTAINLYTRFSINRLVLLTEWILKEPLPGYPTGDSGQRRKDW